MEKLHFTEKDFMRLKYRQKIKWKIEKTFRFPLFVNNFGLHEAVKLIKTKNRLDYLEECERFLESVFSDLIESYKKKFFEFKNSEYTAQLKGEKNIWICWFQGEDRMPEVVKLCINSVKQMADSNIDVHILNLETLHEYIDIPNFIINKVKNGSITLTHFSDICRFELLKNFGGLWVDATCYATQPITVDIFDRALYTIKNDEINNDFYGKFTSFVIGGNKESHGGLFFSFMIEFFYEYHRRFNILIDWHLINIIYAIAYRKFDEIAYLADTIPDNSIQIQMLNNRANDVFDQEVWENICETQVFNKMNWRKNYICHTSRDKETFYNHMLKQVRKV